MSKTMDVDQDFKSQFYNLQGIHINERKKNFYTLLKSTSPTLSEDQIDIQPRNYQENIFYVDVLIQFKKSEKLIGILKGGIGVLTSKILKQRWFFQEAFKNMSEEDIVNNFLPTLSYSLRMKVLKKFALALNEERMDTIFDLVLKRYGMFIAKQILFSCSSGKIGNVLTTNEITLLSEQLKRLKQKDLDLLKVYFREYKKNMNKDFDDYDFLNYLVWKHPDFYFELELNAKSVVKLGRSTSRAVLKSKKEDVLKDIRTSKINKAVLVRDVKEFDKEYLHLFFPADDMKFHYSYSSVVDSYVSKYPIKKRWEVLSRAFKQTYNTEIVDHLDCFDELLAKHFPEDIQQKWAEIKFLDSDNDLTYIKYYDPKKAFKLVKDKINVTSDISLRGRLLNELLIVCHNKNDYSTYKEVLQYICMRHRNDDRNVRANMISHIENYIDYNLITECHWQYINEIINMQRVRGESLSYTLIAEYLLFLYKNKFPLEAPLTQFVKDCIKDNRGLRLWFSLKEPEFQSVVFKQIFKILPTVENHNKATGELLTHIADFNKIIKNDKVLKKEFKKYWIDLNECPLIIGLIREVCTKQGRYDNKDYNVVNDLILYNSLYSEIPLTVTDESSLLDIVKTMFSDNDKGSMVSGSISESIQKPKRNNFENSLLNLFFNDSREDMVYIKQITINYFLAKDPEVIANHFSSILPLEVKYEWVLLDYHIIKNYSHLGLDQKVTTYFKDLVSVKSKCEEKVKLLNALSKVMKTEDFLDLVKDYTPDSKKLDLNDEKQRELYQVQCDVVKAFKNLDKKSLLPPVLMYFCQGDYLQSALGALYKTLYRINEEQAFSYIKVLGERAVSTRKHAVFLGFQLLSLKDATYLYLILSNKETNISAKKYLFSAILKYFVRNPLESILDIVILNINFVDKNDTEMIQRLVESVNKIPIKYKPLFIEKVWSFLDILEQQDVKVFSYRNILLRTITNYKANFILKLNKNFCENVIKEYFLLSDGKLQNLSHYLLDYFVINYLLAYLDEAHFQFVFNIIKSYKDINWESHNKDNIIRFFTNAYENFDENDDTFLKLFTSFWQILFSHEESFSEYSSLRIMNMYKENPNIETFSREVNKFFQELTTEYGPYISELLINSVIVFYSNVPTRHNTDFNEANFAFYLLQSNPSELNCFIAFRIIKNFTGADQRKIYSKVVKALKSVSNTTARIYSNALPHTN